MMGRQRANRGPRPSWEGRQRQDAFMRSLDDDAVFWQRAAQSTQTDLLEMLGEDKLAELWPAITGAGELTWRVLFERLLDWQTEMAPLSWVQVEWWLEE